MLSTSNTPGQIVSALHARFTPEAFALPLSALLASQLAPPNKSVLAAQLADAREREEAVRIARQKVLLRAAAELALVQVLRSTSASAADDAGTTWLYGIVRELVSVSEMFVDLLVARSPPLRIYSCPQTGIIPTCPLRLRSSRA